MFAFDGSNFEDNRTLNWTNSTAWTAVELKDYTSAVMNNNALAYGIAYIDNEVAIGGARTITTKLEYKSGNCALNIRGIEMIDADGNIVAGDYHVGKAGSPSNNNTYTVKVAEAGTYTLRCYATFDGQNRANDTNGTITVEFDGAQASDFVHDVTFVAEYATLHLGHKVAVPEGVEAYAVTEIVDNLAILTEVEGVIPAATSVILKNTGSKQNYTFAHTTREATQVETNLLKGSIANRYVTGEAYVLGIPEGETEAALCKAVLTDGCFLNNAQKAYMPVAKSANNATHYSFSFGGTTGIENVKGEDANVKDVYDLTGRKVETPAKGIYIINGKKILVK